MIMSLRPGICINWLSNMKIVKTAIWAQKLSCLCVLLGPAKSRRLISNCLFAALGLNIPPKFFFESFLDDCVLTIVD